MELLNKLPIEGKKVVANAMLVSEGRPYMKYVEGVKTGIAGTAYNVLLPALDYLNVPVKIEGEMTLRLNTLEHLFQLFFRMCIARLIVILENRERLS